MLQPAVLDPTYEDIFNELPIEAPEGGAGRISYPLMYHHYLAGTIFLRAGDRNIIAGDSPISVLTLRSPDASVFSVWLNRELHLIFGLTAWYHDNVRPVGSIVTLTPTDRAGEFIIEHAGKSDPAIAIDDERLQLLEDRRERLASRPLSVFELLVDIIADHYPGVRFDMLWAEVNVVRRVTRLQIASALSWFKCFDFVGGKTQGWKFVPDRINEGGDEELAEFLIATEDEDGDD